MWTKNLYTRRSAVTKCGSTILAGSTAARGRHSPHGLLSIGHCCFDADVPIHLSKQCIWNICVHSPHTKSAIKQRGTRAHMRVLKINTARAVAQRKKEKEKKKTQLSGQSSPGILQEGQHPSNDTRHIPHTSPSSSSSASPLLTFPDSDSLPMSQRHWATAFQCLTVTFMVGVMVQASSAAARYVMVLVLRNVTPSTL